MERALHPVARGAPAVESVRRNVCQMFCHTVYVHIDKMKTNQSSRDFNLAGIKSKSTELIALLKSRRMRSVGHLAFITPPM